MLPTRNTRFEAYIAPARAHPEIWRMIAGLVTATAIYIAVVLAMFILLLPWGINIGAALTGDGTPLETSILLFSFAGMSLGVIVATVLFQKRGLASLLGPDLNAVMRNFGIAASITLAIMVVWVGIGIVLDGTIPNLPFATWLIWLPSSLVLVLIQTGSEELVFRGYILQQLAARFSSRWIWWVAPSLVFGLAHYDAEGMGPNAWLVVAETFLIGLIAADLTIRTGNLGAAIGLHFTNNCMALLFVALKGDISGLSLHETPYAISDTDFIRQVLLMDMGVIVLLYMAYLIIMGRRGF